MATKTRDDLAREIGRLICEAHREEWSWPGPTEWAALLADKIASLPHAWSAGCVRHPGD